MPGSIFKDILRRVLEEIPGILLNYGAILEKNLQEFLRDCIEIFQCIGKFTKWIPVGISKGLSGSIDVEIRAKILKKSLGNFREECLVEFLKGSLGDLLKKTCEIPKEIPVEL